MKYAIYEGKTLILDGFKSREQAIEYLGLDFEVNGVPQKVRRIVEYQGGPGFYVTGVVVVGIIVLFAAPALLTAWGIAAIVGYVFLKAIGG